jgi:prefoldin subunit 5|tara:strand:- start:20722 stop:20913 length:192 start_codon:yes stop_codon:yes gene_type:complete
MPTNVQLAELVKILQGRLDNLQMSNSRLKDELFEAKQNTAKVENRVRRLEEQNHAARFNQPQR